MNKQLVAQHKELVLETVDLIRMRKARPDFDRINRMLKRIYGLTINETRESLDALVSEGRINRVHFKGNISYRRCLITPNKQSTDTSAQSTSHRIVDAIRTITKETGDGVTVEALQQWLISKNPDTRLVKHRLHNALKREIAAFNVTQLSDNCYVLTESLPKPEKLPHLQPNLTPRAIRPKLEVKEPIQSVAKTSKATESVITPKLEPKEPIEAVAGTSKAAVAGTSKAAESLLKPKLEPIQADNISEKSEKSDQEADGTKRGRPLSQRKKFKKTHGPDFEDPMLFRRLVSRHGRKGESNACVYCSCTAKLNKDGNTEPLLICKDCHCKAHPSCMDYSEGLARRALNSPWQCMVCKTCCICEGVDNAEVILFCDACDKGYHMSCHTPIITNKPKGKWVCSPCKRRLTMEENTSRSKDGSIKVSTVDGYNDLLHAEDEGKDKRQRLKSLNCDRTAVGVKRRRSSLSGAEEEGAFTCTVVTAGAPCPVIPPSPADTFDYEMKMAQQTGRVVLNDNTVYEDASNWKVKDVVKFFSENGYAEHAHIFKEQEIDGSSLLLLHRIDVLTSMGLRLGPAVKMYQKIHRLQQHSQLYTS